MMLLNVNTTDDITQYNNIPENELFNHLDLTDFNFEPCDLNKAARQTHNKIKILEHFLEDEFTHVTDEVNDYFEENIEDVIYDLKCHLKDINRELELENL